MADRTCVEPDCERPPKGRGLCGMHYQRAKRHGMLPPAKNRRWNGRPRDRWEERIRSKYGVDEAAYIKLLAAQGGLCAICERPPQNGRLCVDHSHETGQVRGLLCRRCNIALGYLRDHPDAALRASMYLLQK